MRTNPWLPPPPQASRGCSCRAHPQRCPPSCVLGGSCSGGGVPAFTGTRRCLGSVPSPAERAAGPGQAGARTVWNVECKQSVLPATAQPRIPTGRAVPREQPSPAPAAAQGQLVTLDQIITAPHTNLPGNLSYPNSASAAFSQRWEGTQMPCQDPECPVLPALESAGSRRALPYVPLSTCLPTLLWTSTTTGYLNISMPILKQWTQTLSVSAHLQDNSQSLA